MWIKYVGEKTYSSLEVKNFKSKERRNLKPDVAKHLLEKYPKWFRECKPPVKKVIEAIKEAPAKVVSVLKGQTDKEKEVKDDIDIEEVKKK